MDIQGKIRTILFEDWDPIYINAYPFLTDEYDEYIPHIYNLLLIKSSVNRLARYLHKVEKTEMGTERDISTCYKVAKKLVGLTAPLGPSRQPPQPPSVPPKGGMKENRPKTQCSPAT